MSAAGIKSLHCPDGAYSVSLPNGKHMINGDRYEVIDGRLFRSPFQGNDLYAIKDEITTLKLKAAETLGASDEAMKELDGDLEQALDNLQWAIDKAEEEAEEENPTRSDYDEHNTMNKAQQGIK